MDLFYRVCGYVYDGVFAAACDGEQAHRNVYAPILRSLCCGVFRAVGRPVLGGPLVRGPVYIRLAGCWRFPRSIGYYKKVGALGRRDVYVLLGILPWLWARVL